MSLVLSLVKRFYGLTLALLIGWVAFWLALLPVHSVEPNIAGYASNHQPEKANNIPYIWTTPDLTVGYGNLPRFAPLYLKLEVLLDRPLGVPPAHLEVWEVATDRPLAVIETPTDIHEPYKVSQYIIKIPGVKSGSQDNLGIELRANGFKVAGDSRTLGIRLKSLSISVRRSDVITSVISRPYFPALVLLMLGMIWWGRLLSFRSYETALLLIPVGFVAGAMVNILVYYSWWLCLDGLIMLGLAALWQWKGRVWLAENRPWRPLALIMGAMLSLTGFFVMGPGLAGDVFLFKEWLVAIVNHGPVGVYPYALRLNYPPSTVYQFFLFGLLLQPFGLQNSEIAIKIIMGSSILLTVPVIWWVGFKSDIASLQRARTTLLFSFSLSMLFLPAVWEQNDAWQWLLMAVAFWLVSLGRLFGSSAIQVISTLYKPQGWLILPLYGLIYLLKFGWRKTLWGAIVGLALLVGMGALGFGFDPGLLQTFFGQRGISGDSDWGGVNSFNLMNLLGYNQISVDQPWLNLSNLFFALIYLGVLVVSWRRTRAILTTGNNKSPKEIVSKSSAEWYLAAAVILCFMFFFWIRMHERYLFYGVAFLILAALYRRDLYLPALVLNLLFMFNMLFVYIPAGRDTTPNNFFFWRHFLNSDLGQNGLCLAGIVVCLWLGWLYLQPPSTPLKVKLPSPSPSEVELIAESK